MTFCVHQDVNPGNINEKIILSIVCAVYNGSETIGEFLQSYAMQDCTHAELIIMDGGSSDSTVEIVKESGIADLIFSEPDNGIYDAWNKALLHCSGTHIAFIGADDLIVDRALRHIVVACEGAAKSVNIIAGFNILTRDRLPVQLLGDVYDSANLIYRMPIAHVLSAHSIGWLRDMGGFDSSFRSAGDYELLLRSSLTINVLTIPHILAYMEDGGASRKAILPHLEHWRARRINRVSYLLSVVLLIKALVGSLLRKTGEARLSKPGK